MFNTRAGKYNTRRRVFYTWLRMYCTVIRAFFAFIGNFVIPTIAAILGFAVFYTRRQIYYARQGVSK